MLEPLAGKTVLIVGAGGGVGSFATQFAANGGASVIATVRGQDAERMRAYGATETIGYAAIDLPDAVRQAHPDGIDVLIDVVDAEAPGFTALAKAPPITGISLEEAPAALNPAQARPASGKTVITV